MGVLNKKPSIETKVSFLFVIQPFGRSNLELEVHGLNQKGMLNQLLETTVTKILYYGEDGKSMDVKELLKAGCNDVYNGILEAAKKHSKLF